MHGLLSCYARYVNYMVGYAKSVLTILLKNAVLEKVRFAFRLYVA